MNDQVCTMTEDKEATAGRTNTVHGEEICVWIPDTPSARATCAHGRPRVKADIKLAHCQRQD